MPSHRQDLDLTPEEQALLAFLTALRPQPQSRPGAVPLHAPVPNFDHAREPSRSGILS